MNKLALSFSLLLMPALSVACGDSDGEQMDLGVDAGIQDASPSDASSSDASEPVVTVLNAADAPFSAGTGSPSFLGTTRFLASTATTVVVYDRTTGRPDSTYVPLTLTSTQFGGNAAGGIATYSTRGAEFAFFLPTGAPQLGLIDLSPPSAVSTEALLAVDLEGGFSSDLEVVGGRVYVADAPFGLGSTVRVFSPGDLSPPTPLLEDVARRFALPTEDLDGDGTEDLLIAGRLSFSPDGARGFVAFTVAGNSAPALAGGIFAFDVASGLETGRVLVPTAGSSTIAQGFVSGFAITSTKLLVVTAEKQFLPSFVELGGHLSVYEISGSSPFAVLDEDLGARYDQPSSRVATSDDNPVGLAVIDDVVLVVNAPFFLDGSLDVFQLGATLSLRRSLPLGGLYQTGYSVPADPIRVPATRQFLLGTEAGTLRFEVAPR